MEDIKVLINSNVRGVMFKEWGREIILFDNKEYTTKILEVDPQQSTSYHFHDFKEENWYVLEGEGLIALVSDSDDELFEITKGSVIHVKCKTRHSIKNTSNNTVLRVLECHNGHDYDVVRMGSFNDAKAECIEVYYGA